MNKAKQLPNNYKKYKQQKTIDYSDSNNNLGVVFFDGFACDFAFKANVDERWIETCIPQYTEEKWPYFPIFFVENRELKTTIIRGDIIILSLTTQGEFIEIENN